MTSSGTSARAQRGADRLSIVYRADNLVTGHFYLGVSMCSLAKRRREHLHAARKGSKSRFYNAIRKYGEENFQFSIIETVENYQIALRREVELIASLKPTYNLTNGGEGCAGFKMPRYIVERLAERQRGSVGYWRGKTRPKASEKTRERLKANNGKYWLGKKRSPETIEKIRIAKAGKPRGPVPDHVMEVFRNNMRRAAMARRRKVRCPDDGLVFDCAADAAKHYGLKTLSISQVCGNTAKRKTLFGRRFEYTA